MWHALILQVYSLFLDEQRSCEFLKEYQDEFMFNYSDAPTEEASTEKMETSTWKHSYSPCTQYSVSIKSCLFYSPSHNHLGNGWPDRRTWFCNWFVGSFRLKKILIYLSHDLWQEKEDKDRRLKMIVTQRCIRGILWLYKNDICCLTLRHQLPL